MKYEEISGLSEKELVKRTRDLRKQMFEANMKNALGQLTNPMTIREMRRDVARFQTALTAKARGEATETTKTKTKSRAARPTAKRAVKKGKG